MKKPAVEAGPSHEVGATGFEPAAFRPPDERSTKLSYAPMALNGVV